MTDAAQIAAATIRAALPGHDIVSRRDDANDQWSVAITTPDFNPVAKTGRAFGGRGETEAEALNAAYAAAQKGNRA